jgi:hypothetical protein
MKNIWTEIFGEEKSCLWVEENCVFTEKLLKNKIPILTKLASFVD